MEINHDIIYNTTDVFIEKFGDLQTDKFSETVDNFMKDFKVENLLGSKELKLSEVLFVCNIQELWIGKELILHLNFVMNY